MILGFLTKYRDYRAQVHRGPGGDTSTSYIMEMPLGKLANTSPSLPITNFQIVQRRNKPENSSHIFGLRNSKLFFRGCDKKT